MIWFLLLNCFVFRVYKKAALMQYAKLTFLHLSYIQASLPVCCVVEAHLIIHAMTANTLLLLCIVPFGQLGNK